MQGGHVGKVDSVNMYEACLTHARADRALRLVVAKQLERFDLTMMEWLLMATVSGSPGKGMTMSAVAQALNVTLPQVTALANNLVRSKLIKQKINTRDKRSRYLTATPAGKRLIERVEVVIDDTLRTWLANIPKDQLRDYMNTLEMIAALPPPSS